MKQLPHWFDILKKLKLEKKMLPRDVRTQWNSTFKMLNSANEYKSAIDSLTGNRAMGMRKCELSEEEFGIAEELRDVLRVSHKHQPNPVPHSGDGQWPSVPHRIGSFQR
jgi:hypothetical protein